MTAPVRSRRDAQAPVRLQQPVRLRIQAQEPGQGDCTPEGDHSFDGRLLCSDKRSALLLDDDTHHVVLDVDTPPRTVDFRDKNRLYQGRRHVRRTHRQTPHVLKGPPGPHKRDSFVRFGLTEYPGTLPIYHQLHGVKYGGLRQVSCWRDELSTFFFPDFQCRVFDSRKNARNRLTDRHPTLAHGDTRRDGARLNTRHTQPGATPSDDHAVRTPHAPALCADQLPADEHHVGRLFYPPCIASSATNMSANANQNISAGVSLSITHPRSHSLAVVHVAKDALPTLGVLPKGMGGVNVPCF